jgi:hypothetical protein
VRLDLHYGWDKRENVLHDIAELKQLPLETLMMFNLLLSTAVVDKYKEKK